MAKNEPKPARPVWCVVGADGFVCDFHFTRADARRQRLALRQESGLRHGDYRVVRYVPAEQAAKKGR